MGIGNNVLVLFIEIGTTSPTQSHETYYRFSYHAHLLYGHGCYVRVLRFCDKSQQTKHDIFQTKRHISRNDTRV